jgi:soluble lytic murein transglycosylase-like protein
MKWLLPLLLLFLLPGNSKADVPSPLAEGCVQHYAAHYRVPPELIAALIDVESRWNPRALSNKGAMGLMQLMPDTARRYGAVQPFAFGTDHLSQRAEWEPAVEEFING